MTTIEISDRCHHTNASNELKLLAVQMTFKFSSFKLFAKKEALKKIF